MREPGPVFAVWPDPSPLSAWWERVMTHGAPGPAARGGQDRKNAR
ncbi:hypothetical protein [Nocardia huaxiensis]|nr:hypothetical protein [Nocardia huaxiensis]